MDKVISFQKNGYLVLSDNNIKLTYNGMKIVVFQINFVDKTEAIQNICPVRSKQPGHIDSSIVTAEEIKNEFLSWLTK